MKRIQVFDAIPSAFFWGGAAMTSAERHLTWFLRLTALMLLSAAGAILLPYSWMNTCSEWLNLGTLPTAPLVSYLTRSISALYAAIGACFWFMSYDVPRYLPLLRFTIPLTLLFDVTIITLDVLIPMPLSWLVGEGIAILAWTAALWWLVRRCETPNEPRS